MGKFQLLHALLLHQGLAEPDQFQQPLPAPRRWLELVHARSYHQAFARGELSRAAERRIGLPATTPLVRRSWLAVGGTVLTARLALQHGLACHLAGGTHHAFPDYGSGFCIFNDCAVASDWAIRSAASRLIGSRWAQNSFSASARSSSGSARE